LLMNPKWGMKGDNMKNYACSGIDVCCGYFCLEYNRGIYCFNFQQSTKCMALNKFNVVYSKYVLIVHPY